MRPIHHASLAVALALSGARFAHAEINAQIDRRIPDEYEAVGGHAPALGNAGAAALGGVSSVRVNPAMLAMEPQYSLSAGYTWPTEGRDFYQAGVVDTKTASFAAGFLYTGFPKKPQDDPFAKPELDSPVRHRFALGLAKNLSHLAVGLNVGYVDAQPPEAGAAKRVDGVTAGVGVAGLLTPQIRLGASVENAANAKVKDYAPTVVRMGLAYIMAGGGATAHLDLKQRERVARYEGDYASLGGVNAGYREPERQAIVSFSAKMYDVIRVLGAYGRSLTGEDDRASVSGGIALVNQGASVSYSASRPYLRHKEVQHAVNLGLMITM